MSETGQITGSLSEVSNSAPADEPATEPKWIKSAVWSALLVVLGTIVIAWAWTLQTDKIAILGPPPPVGRDVPEFTLIERDGRTVTKKDLLGLVWIADFIFTRCSGPCPELSARMAALQRTLKGEPDVRLVSFTLDPESDRPEVLQDYAKRFKAEKDRWLFLTCDSEPYMYDLTRYGFFQTVIPETQNTPMIHSEYFVVIDRQGRIRSAYDGIQADTKAKVLSDVKHLLMEPRVP